MASNGARKSTLPNRIPHWEMHKVISKARVGSPRDEDTANGLRNGIIPSFAMACNNQRFTKNKYS